jgi:hypothetical protein
MPKTTYTSVQELSLDLHNFRTVPQSNEVHAVQAMIALKPERFWALVESLIDDGYLPTENILVLHNEKDQLIVKEGNRRVAALKFLHGYLLDKTIIPPSEELKKKIDKLSASWKKINSKVPCTIYDNKDSKIVDRIVQLAHGKGEKAGRDQWNAIARARHNRDFVGDIEPGLDLLEKYLKKGMNITTEERELWAGEYPLTILQEAIDRIASRFQVDNSSALAKKYPAIANRIGLEQLINDIGNKIVTFKTIRAADDFGVRYGLAPILVSTTTSGPDRANPTATAPTAPTTGSSASAQPATSSQPATTTSVPPTQPSTPSNPTGKPIAVAINDPKSVQEALRNFVVLGNHRDKVALLRNEAIALNLKKNPLAFCFLLRSMFEISAKAYCDDHVANNGPKYLKSDGADRRLVDILRDIQVHLTNPTGSNQDKAMVKALHGAMVELGKDTDGILSVTSMNQLIHNPSFSLTANDICTIFGNVFPLLSAMNQ